MKLVKHILIRGTIHCLTGLRIGGSKDQVDIGGIDNNIIRHPITGEPYIPGSSLKGKMRSLLEYRYSQEIKNGPCSCNTVERHCPVCEYFGSRKETNAPTRVLVRDAKMSPASRKWLTEAPIDQVFNYAEVKWENVIQRKSGSATPRQQERVPAGTEFVFEISIRVFDIDNEEDLINFVLEGMELLQKDYLGSSGGRGYGQIQFQNVTIDDKMCDRFKNRTGNDQDE
ncbi:type III-A CRISPR-associated RAMP protein Csm3 [Thermoactinomyces mirandus]|uniref:CRISPR system Cms endoribonuclease Csm3 n=1 Tax=Thermoactinomyces mirandus TaxID=2756294 RepID=A0A7W2AS42_9BACL|nr:type III-A CRISPR-associated RAMP protein Csm3 [Thermoactinomyces mirandus]MBA4602061.1 type III-A CRISPR-associated RAMP protein Csm3 [Thermoactinomyces mirandus]